MSDWIKERAAEIRRIETNRKAERDHQVQAATVLKTRLEPFWNELTQCLRQSVSTFNEEFPEKERRIDHFDHPTPAGLTIKRNAYPSVLVKVQLNNSGTAVNYALSRTQKKGTDPIETQGTCAFGVVGDSVTYIESAVHSHEDVAKLFLDPFFDF